MIYVKLLLTAIFWGGTFIAGRTVAQHVGPFSAAFMRFTTASVILLFLTWRAEGRLPAVKKNQVLPLILMGMTGIFSYNLFFFKGLKLIEAGRAALIIANNPIGIAVMSAVLFKERISALKAVGIVLSVFGALIVITRGDFSAVGEGGGVKWGEFFIFICVVSWVTFSLIGKTILTGMSPLVSITYASVVGTAALFFPALGEGVFAHMDNYTGLDYLCVFYLGFFGTVLGFVWFYEGIKALGPTRAGQFINFVPVSAILLGYFLLDEPVTASLFVGAVFVITGVYLTNTANLPTGARKVLAFINPRRQ